MNDLSQWRVRIIPGPGGFELKQLIHLIRDKLIDSKRSHDLNWDIANENQQVSKLFQKGAVRYIIVALQKEGKKFLSSDHESETKRW